MARSKMTEVTVLQQALDVVRGQNEQLQLENLRFKSNGPKLYKSVVRFSSSFQTMRGGVATNFKQLGSALASDFTRLTTAVTAVDVATRSIGSAERERSVQLEASLQESQATVQVQEGRLQALAMELDRQADTHRDSKELFDKERARAEEMEREINSLNRDSAVKDSRIACLEKMQATTTSQVRVLLQIRAEYNPL